MKPDNKAKLIQIFDGTPWQAGMVKNMLENAGIEVFLKDEILGSIAPWFTGAPGYGSVKVEVSTLDYDKAKLIVEEYERNIGPNN